MQTGFALANIVPDRESPVPLHQQLCLQLRAPIETGSLPRGTPLPSTRAQARGLRLGRNAIIAAHDQLMLEGYLSARRAAPPVVRDLPLRTSPLPSSKGDLRTRLFARGNVMAAQPCRHGEPGATAFRTGLPDAGQFPFNTWSRLRTRRAKLARSDGGGADRHQDQGNDLCLSELRLGHRLDGLR